MILDVCNDVFVPYAAIEPRSYIDTSLWERVDNQISVNITCNMGFQPQAVSTHQCDAGIWQPEVYPTCERVGKGDQIYDKFLYFVQNHHCRDGILWQLRFLQYSRTA